MIASLLLLSAAAGAAPAADAPPPARHVVVVGVNESLDEGVAPLSFADDDAARYAEVLGRGASSLTVLTVLDAETQPLHPRVAGVARAPTSTELSRSLERVFASIEADQAAGRDADLIFVYVGHGAVDERGEGYVNLLDEKLERSDLFDQLLAKSPARFNHVVVDACSAYHLLHRGTGKSGKAAVLAARRLLQRQSLKRYPNTGVLLSTSSDVQTHEWSRIRGGVFSHEVLSALSGAADVDGDGELRYQEVGAFIEAANAGVKDRRARIDFFIQPPRLYLERPVLRTDDEAGPAIALGRGDEGHFVVEDSRGVVLAEVNKNGEQPLALRLSGEGPWRITRNGETWVTASDLDRPTRLARLDEAPEGDALTARSAVTEALERGLFKQPFGRSYVDGYAARLYRDLAAQDDGSPQGPQAKGVAGPAERGAGGPGVGAWVLPGFGLGTMGLAAAAAVAFVGAAAISGIAAWPLVQRQIGGGPPIDAFAAQQLSLTAQGAGAVAAGAAAAAVALGAGGGALTWLAWPTGEPDPPPRE